jgi:hypothetical protein
LGTHFVPASDAAGSLGCGTPLLRAGGREVYKNLSRLTTQWEERVQKAIFAAAQESERRLDELLATVSEILLKQDRSATAEVSACLMKIREALEKFPDF